MKKETQGMLAGFAGVVIFALTLPATRYAIMYLDPMFVGLGRSVIAALVAGALLWVFNVPVPTKNQFVQLGIVALGVVVGFPFFSTMAMKTLTAVHGGVVAGVLPMATAIAGVLLTRERPSLGFWLTGIAGGLAVVYFAYPEGFQTLLVGDIFLASAIISAALGYALGGRLSTEMGGWQVICWALVLAFPLLLVPAGMQLPSTTQHIPVMAWLCFVYLALGSQLLGFVFWYKGLVLGGIVRVSQIQLLQPFITLMAAALLLGEKLDARTIFFALLVMALVAVGRRMQIRNIPLPATDNRSL
ncbi:MAG TPA: DMT family transporter [Gammaproteobacteria bacterium]|nr:DMT family transporter [Gammaproteobacteria bacterium]